MPHSLVESTQKPDKPRLIFDARSKLKSMYLNDALHNGPLLMTDMLDVLFFFREKPHAVSMDITRMFLQVCVRKEDQSVFRFFWRRPGDPGPPISYVMIVLVFGASSSPTSAAFVLRHIVNDNPEYSDVADLIRKKFYVDNYLDSFEMAEKGITTCKRLQELLFLGGTSSYGRNSSRDILQSLPATESANPDLIIDKDALLVHRTMGLEWNVGRRFLLFHLGHTESDHQEGSALSRIGHLRPYGIPGSNQRQSSTARHGVSMTGLGTKREETSKTRLRQFSATCLAE